MVNKRRYRPVDIWSGMAAGTSTDKQEKQKATKDKLSDKKSHEVTFDTVSFRRAAALAGTLAYLLHPRSLDNLLINLYLKVTVVTYPVTLWQTPLSDLAEYEYPPYPAGK